MGIIFFFFILLANIFFYIMFATNVYFFFIMFTPSLFRYQIRKDIKCCHLAQLCVYIYICIYYKKLRECRESSICLFSTDLSTTS